MVFRCLYILPFKGLGSAGEIHTFIQQRCNKLIKSDSKEIVMLQNISISFELSIH